MIKSYYSKDFFCEQKKGSLKSAKEVVPLVIDLIKPKSVIDVGCGIGAWLSVFREYGISDIFGIDGEWVDKSLLLIPEDKFLVFDLKKPLQINRKFDLVISLEVAEHLPKEFAETFIDSLAKLGDVILFSAAIPFQGGTHHLNEQWPDYWAEKFFKRGFFVVDCIRKKIWKNENVDFWYAQNILLFVKKEYLSKNSHLEKEFKNTNLDQLSIVHPKMYLWRAKYYKIFPKIPLPIRSLFKKISNFIIKL
jgi:SAM-dependent methyltransferase